MQSASAGYCCCCLQLKQLHKLDLSQLQFVGESLKLLRQEVGGNAAVLGEWGSRCGSCASRIPY
jgi:hypothetical protein